MFFLILGLSLCEGDNDNPKRCYTTKTDIVSAGCEEGSVIVKVSTTLADPVTATDVVITAGVGAETIVLNPDVFPKIKEIKTATVTGSPKSTTATVGLTASPAQINSFSLTNIVLKISASGSSVEVKFKDVILTKSSIEAVKGDQTPTLAIDTLKTDSFKEAVALYKSIKKATGVKLTIEGDDLITSVKGGTSKWTITGTDGAIDVDTDTMYSIDIKTKCTNPADLTFSGTFSGTITSVITITVKKPDVVTSMLSLKFETGFKKADSLKLVPLTAIKLDATLDPSMKCWDTAGDKFMIRKELPGSGNIYCLKENSGDGTCKVTEIELRNEAEIIICLEKQGDEVIEINIFGFTTNSLKLALKTMCMKNFILSSGDSKKIPIIELSITGSDGASKKVQGFNGVQLKLPTTGTAVKFGNLSLSNVTYPTGSSSKILRTVSETTAETITSDISSLASIPTGASLKATNAFTLNEPSLDSLELTSNGIKVASTAAKSNQIEINKYFDKDPILMIGGKPTFKCETGVKSKTLNIVMTKHDLIPTFTGSGWTGVAIELIANKNDGKFNATIGKGGTKPDFTNKGNGTAYVDGVKLVGKDEGSPTPTDKGGLSGGAIAGIVIAVVVVVAAVVVGVVFVIKKKGKVAN